MEQIQRRRRRRRTHGDGTFPAVELTLNPLRQGAMMLSGSGREGGGDGGVGEGEGGRGRGVIPADRKQRVV